ncbi:alanine racemase [Alicyclobacillus fastidiosus]|uniref:Alanine racemase n=1 Tax=Alicyclobacillus fastidiosus TaxID=392011 RepID=A0ABV5AGE8_9BACL|nr:alanine racemase [Alicyclobacillus fastidiosus]WEH08985.1 alanine racemase [Alicyclobacillus fastidiosus]
MFLHSLLECNPTLVDTSLALYQEGRIPPNSYILDIDQVSANATALAKAARKSGISLYFMTKQIGRNPIASQAIVEAGISKAVAVDPVEALLLADQGVALGHVGHLVQVPPYYLDRILSHQPEVMTVFSLEAAANISKAARKRGIVQKLLLRVVRDGDYLYDAQHGGFAFESLATVAERIADLPNVTIAGVTSFPSLMVEQGVAKPTRNFETLCLATDELRKLGVVVEQINAPSVTSVSTIPTLAQMGATHGEPGHALTGTTPLHTVKGQTEVPAYLYVTEVSHVCEGESYVFGGGYYPRGNVQHALVSSQVGNPKLVRAVMPDAESIDYYLKVEGEFPVGTPVIFAFRTQMFVTRANVVPIVGASSSRPRVEGIYNVEGKQVK